MELRGTALSYQVGEHRLLESVDVLARSGELVAVVGPNGAGKSTLLKILAGDLTPSSGEIMLNAQPLNQYSAQELALLRAVLPQQSILQFAFRVDEVVAMGRHPHGESERDEAIIREAMNRTDTGRFADRRYPSLSGGEQSRTMLARVLAQKTPLMLLDEPTAALDIHHQELVLNIAREHAQSGGAVIAILHDLNLAAAYANRIMVLAGGRLVADGEPWQVIEAELLSDVFRHPLAVFPHPCRDCPFVVSNPDESTTTQQRPLAVTNQLASASSRRSST